MSVPLSTGQFAGPGSPLSLERVLLDSVQLSQHVSTMDASKVERMAKTWSSDMDPPVIAERDGEYTVLDGHHRVMAAKARGHKYVRARISR